MPRREQVEHEHFHAPAFDDLATFGRARALLAVGAVLWLVNRLGEG